MNVIIILQVSLKNINHQLHKCKSLICPSSPKCSKEQQFLRKTIHISSFVISVLKNNILK